MKMLSHKIIEDQSIKVFSKLNAREALYLSIALFQILGFIALIVFGIYAIIRENTFSSILIGFIIFCCIAYALYHIGSPFIKECKSKILPIIIIQDKKLHLLNKYTGKYQVFNKKDIRNIQGSFTSKALPFYLSSSSFYHNFTAISEISFLINGGKKVVVDAVYPSKRKYKDDLTLKKELKEKSQALGNYLAIHLQKSYFWQN